MTITRLTTYLPAALILLAACSPSEPEWADDTLPVHRDYLAPASVQRLAWTPVEGYDGAASDFLVRSNGDTLIVLDARAAEVTTLVRQAPNGPDGSAHWQRASSFGRIGDGPGEFRRVAALADGENESVWTWSESARLQQFSLDGTLIRENRIAIPCVFFRSSLASMNGALFVGGQCPSGGGSQDTVYARVFQLWPDTSGTLIASAPVATMDFSFGSLLSAQRFVSEGSKSVIFMSGIDSCTTAIRTRHAASPGEQVRDCTPPPALYRSREPSYVKELKMPGGATPRWPDPITPLFAQVDAQPRVIVQIVSEDSLALTRWEAGAEPFLFAPANSFAGCRAEYCLWFDAGESRLALVRPAALAADPGDGDESRDSAVRAASMDGADQP